MTRNGTLAVAVGNFRSKFNGDMSRLKRAVMIKLFSAVIKDTPVGTSDPKRHYTGGRLRGNWTFTVGTPERTRRVNFSDPTPRVTEGVESKVNEQDGKVFLTNNMPYAGRIEYDGWSHTKAPEGMVRRNLIRIAANLKKEAARLATQS